MPKIVSNKQQTTRPLNCLICDRPTTGFHYNVASCKGCKTFFRRVVLSKINEECSWNRDCFDLQKRSAPLLRCRACRYKQCLSVGMSAKTMNLEMERFERRKKLTSDEESVLYSLNLSEGNTFKLLDLLSNLEEKLEKFRESSYYPEFADSEGLDVLIDGPNRLSISDNFEPVPSFSFSAHQDSAPLPSSRIRLLAGKLPERKPGQKRWFFYNLMTTIEYIKTFEFFNLLNRSDKLVLVKYVSLAIMNLHISYFSVSKKYCTTIHPDGTKEPLEDEIHYSTIVMSLFPLMRYQVEKSEYLLLKAIFLCNPAIPNLSVHAQNLLSKHRLKFADALRDYCLRRYENGPAHFAEVISVIGVLERQQRQQKDLHLLYVAPIIANLPKTHITRTIDQILDS